MGISVVAQETTAGANCTGGGATSSPTCTYGCVAGYSIVGGGDGEISCDLQGNWDAAPMCEAKPCDATNVENSTMYDAVGSVTGVTGDVITVACSKGYSGG